MRHCCPVCGKLGYPMKMKDVGGQLVTVYKHKAKSKGPPNSFGFNIHRTTYCDLKNSLHDYYANDPDGR